jgi:hypothetical protein
MLSSFVVTQPFNTPCLFAFGSTKTCPGSGGTGCPPANGFTSVISTFNSSLATSALAFRQSAMNTASATAIKGFLIP